jgi:hypothetical protein
LLVVDAVHLLASTSLISDRDAIYLSNRSSPRLAMPPSCAAVRAYGRRVAAEFVSQLFGGDEAFGLGDRLKDVHLAANLGGNEFERL